MYVGDSIWRERYGTFLGGWLEVLPYAGTGTVKGTSMVTFFLSFPSFPYLSATPREGKKERKRGENAIINYLQLAKRRIDIYIDRVVHLPPNISPILALLNTNKQP